MAAMTFNQLKSAFEADVGDSPILANWFNEAMRDLAPVVGTIASFSYGEAEAGTGYALPDDFLAPVDNAGGWIHYDGLIYFPCHKPRQVTIYYRQQPVPFDGVTGGQECSLPEAVQYLLPFYACMAFWQMEGEGDPHEQNNALFWQNRYQQGKALAMQRTLEGSPKLMGWHVE